jgi:hypothetical protein
VRLRVAEAGHHPGWRRNLELRSRCASDGVRRDAEAEGGGGSRGGWKRGEERRPESF